MGSGNWIIDNLNAALETWNEKLAEIWQLLTMSPEAFRGGGIWSVIVDINDRLEIAKLLGISENQLSYVTNAESGSGLLKCAGAIVPVQDRYPHNATYRLMTTKPSEMEIWQA